MHLNAWFPVEVILPVHLVRAREGVDEEGDVGNLGAAKPKRYLGGRRF